MLISRKLPISGAILTLLSIGVASVLGIYFGSQGIETVAMQKLEAISDGRRNQVQTYLENIEKDLIATSERKDVIASLAAFDKVFKSVEGDATKELQRRYISENPNEAGQRHKLNSAEVDNYDKIHARYHQRFMNIVDSQGYNDMFLINRDGDIVYSAFKGRDYATNLKTGQWSKTDVATLFNEAMSNFTDKQNVYFRDYQPYGPADNAPTSFIGRAIKYKEQPIGVLVFEMPSDTIKTIMENRTGLGQKGETVLLNRDGFLISDSPFTAENDILRVQVDSPFVGQVSETSHTSGELEGYRDQSSLIALTQVNFRGAGWVVAALSERGEAFAALTKMRNAILLAALLLTIGSVLAFIYVSRSITLPIEHLVKQMQTLASGNTNVDIVANSRNDEIGDMINAVQVFRDAAIEKTNLEQQSEAAREQSDTDRLRRDQEKASAEASIRNAIDSLRTGLDALAAGDLTVRLDEEFGEGLDSLRISYNSASDKLEDALFQVTQSIGAMHTKASEMRSATDQLSVRTETQAKSLQEASAAIEEITVTVKQSAEDAQSASSKAEDAKRDAENSRTVVDNAMSTMSRIEEDSNKIASIIGVIDEISFQTNLLALNAGVEAARAGDAGRGFAVVAEEVRELAQRSTVAAQDIKQLIESSTHEVEQGVKNVTATGDALNTISAHVGDISEFIGSIAVVTGEQSVGLEECNLSVTALDGSTQQNAAMAEETTAVTNQLAADASDLAQLVTRFKIGARSDAIKRKAA